VNLLAVTVPSQTRTKLETPHPCRLYQNQDDVDEQVIAACLVELAQHSAHTWVPEEDFSSNSHHVAQFTWTLGTCLQRQAALHQQALVAVRQYLLAVATSGTAAGAGVADVDSSVSGPQCSLHPCLQYALSMLSAW
jgi:hypothetical protein